MLKLGVLASGNGSNFQAIAEACRNGELDAEVALLVTDQPEAFARERARELGIPERHLPYDRNNRHAFEQATAELFDAAGVTLVILAGFMRLLTPTLISAYEGRILNIHPSLLPSFKGLDGIGQALRAGVKVTGCTVHLVTLELDSGPILAQEAVDILPDDTHDTLAERIHAAEHRTYKRAIADFMQRD